jgi:hypothetical protein
MIKNQFLVDFLLWDLIGVLKRASAFCLEDRVSNKLN